MEQQESIKSTPEIELTKRCNGIIKDFYANGLPGYLDQNRQLLSRLSLDYNITSYGKDNFQSINEWWEEKQLEKIMRGEDIPFGIIVFNKTDRSSGCKNQQMEIFFIRLVSDGLEISSCISSALPKTILTTYPIGNSDI